MLTGGAADVVALGKAALGNRDWPNRVRNGRPLDELNASLFAPVADVKDWGLELLSKAAVRGQRATARPDANFPLRTTRIQARGSCNEGIPQSTGLDEGGFRPLLRAQPEANADKSDSVKLAA
ncbi:hypothetical protein GCM10027038_38400 [Arthrobacter bambusae]